MNFGRLSWNIWSFSFGKITCLIDVTGMMCQQKMLNSRLILRFWFEKSYKKSSFSRYLFFPIYFPNVEFSMQKRHWPWLLCVFIHFLSFNWFVFYKNSILREKKVVPSNLTKCFTPWNMIRFSLLAKEGVGKILILVYYFQGVKYLAIFFTDVMMKTMLHIWKKYL